MFYIRVRVEVKIKLSLHGDVWRSGDIIPSTFKLGNRWM
jgi:hypothetical protein